jgi:hypothetical protein
VSRADKIWLGIAIALVVLMVAGFSFLLFKRSETLASEAGKPKNDSVSLTPLTTSPPVPLPKPKPKPKTPESLVPKPPASGAQVGFVTKVSKNSGEFQLSFDPGSFETGQEAIKAANKARTTPTDGWFVANETHKIQKYTIDPKAQIIVAHPEAAPPSTSKMGLQAFKDAFPGGAKEDTRLQKAPFWIVLEGDRVVRIEELHAP